MACKQPETPSYDADETPEMGHEAWLCYINRPWLKK